MTTERDSDFDSWMRAYNEGNIDVDEADAAKEAARWIMRELEKYAIQGTDNDKFHIGKAIARLKQKGVPYE